MTRETAYDVDRHGGLTRALGLFGRASAELLSTRALQQRVDRKYLLPEARLEPLLDLLRADYAVVHSAGMLLAAYATLYLDTREFQTYEDHRRGRRPRCKVRLRHHLDRQVSFLEIKRKDGARTTKLRLLRTFGDETLDPAAVQFVDAHCWLGATRLSPRLSVRYRRITLVGLVANERITIDSDIEFTNG